MTAPKRVQMTRQRLWRADHPDAVIVTRPSKWGNPWKITHTGGQYSVDVRGIHHGDFATRTEAAQHAVRAFRWQIENHPNVVGFTVDDVRTELAGLDLACWCPLDQPCHADVLLELANPEPDEQPWCELARCPRKAEPGSLLCTEHQVGAGRRP